MISAITFFASNVIVSLVILIIYPIIRNKIKKIDDDQFDDVRAESDSSATNEVDSNPFHPYQFIIEKIVLLLSFKNYFLSFLTLFLLRSLAFMVYKFNIDFFTIFVYVCFIQFFILLIWKAVLKKQKEKKSDNKESDKKENVPDQKENNSVQNDQFKFDINKFYLDAKNFSENIKKFWTSFKSYNFSIPAQLFLTALLWLNFYSYSSGNSVICLITTEFIFILPSILNYRRIRNLFRSSSDKAVSDVLFVPFYFFVIFLLIVLASKFFEVMPQFSENIKKILE